MTELDEFDYELGLAIVTREDSHEAPIFSSVLFEFDSTSAYGALQANSRQCNIIREHFDQTEIPVHYMFYNPLILPWALSYPVNDYPELPPREFGIRIIDAQFVHSRIEGRAGSPKVSDLGEIDTKYIFGISLEDFFVEVIKCKEGYEYDGEKDIGLRKLFSRKSGPIFGVVEIVIENSDS